jgi:hypothetical protein
MLNLSGEVLEFTALCLAQNRLTKAFHGQQQKSLLSIMLEKMKNRGGKSLFDSTLIFSFKIDLSEEKHHIKSATVLALRICPNNEYNSHSADQTGDGSQRNTSTVFPPLLN